MDLTVDRIKQINCGSCGHSIDTTKVKPLSSVRCPGCGAEAIVPASMGSLLLVKVLGKGTSGIVCLALDDKLHRQVAVKILRKSGRDDDQLVKATLAEARALARLNHPNVVQIYAVGEHEGQPYIEMELVSGGRLDKMIAQGEQIDPARAIQIAIDVAAGLNAALGVGLIHRDVKPANIPLSRKGEAKLLDFGTAQFHRKDQEQGIVGTPYYVAPEIVRQEKADFRCDIYSLGATLFHVLAHRPPFEGTDPRQVIMARLHKRAPDLRQVLPQVHPAVAAVVNRMLEPEPADRHASYDQLLTELRQVLGTLEAQSMSAAALSAVSVAGDAAAVAASSVGRPSPAAHRFAPRPGMSGLQIAIIAIVAVVTVACLAGIIWWAATHSRGGTASPTAAATQADESTAAQSASRHQAGETLAWTPPSTTTTPQAAPTPAVGPDAPASPTTPAPTTTPTPAPTPAPADVTPAPAPAPTPPPTPTPTPQPAPVKPPTPSATPAPPPTPVPDPLPAVTPPYHALITAGADKVTDADGNKWSPVQPYNPDKPGGFGYVDGARYVSDKIADPLLRSYLYQPEALRFDVPNGRYLVTLMFAEPVATEAGRRLFSVTVEGKPAATDLDLAAEAGLGKAVMRTTIAEVRDGRLDIGFQSPRRHQIINAVRVQNAPPPDAR